MRRTLMSLAALSIIFGSTSCGLLKGGKLSGWWVTKSALVQGQRVDLTSADVAYMAGFNDSFQGYTLGGADKCSGKEQSYTSTDGKIEVSSLGDCPARMAKFSISGDNLSLKDVRYFGELIAEEVEMVRISHSEAMRLYNNMKNRAGTAPDEPGSGGSTGTGTGGYGAVSMSQLTGYWLAEGITAQGKYYANGETVNGSKIYYGYQIVHEFTSGGKFMQYQDNTSPFPSYMSYSIAGSKVTISGTGFETLNFDVKSISSSSKITSGLVYRYNGNAVQEHYRKLTDSEAANLLKDNTTYKTLHP